jgi:hypothetical protein
MLAITASTTPSTETTDVVRIHVPSSLDRAERGETDDFEEGGGTSHETGFEHVVVRVGVVETIKTLWDNDTPIVRRFR